MFGLHILKQSIIFALEIRNESLTKTNKTMATVKQIFDRIDTASVYYVMSAIPYEGRTYEQCERVLERREELKQFVAADSLAAKILDTDKHLTVKQLWVIAYALEKSAEFCAKVDASVAEAKAKAAASNAKLAANKAASADVLAQVKQAGKLLKDYYAWLKNSSYKKEFYSKKYTQASVDAFLTQE